MGAKVGNELKEGMISLCWRLFDDGICELPLSCFALAGILALIHDDYYAERWIIFEIDLNLEVVAALLTLIGYSINDTIIIFDRIRERMRAKRQNK